MADIVSISVADVAASVTVGLILWGIKSVSSGRKEIVGSVTELSKHVAQTNGRIGRLEVGLDAHIKQDDERHDGVTREQDAMWRELGKRKGDQ